MGKLGRGGLRKTKAQQLKEAAALVVFKPQGKDHKRTPKTIAEQEELASEEFFEPELIEAERTSNGVLQFLVRWKGYDKKYDTWEPLVHLPGSEDLIRDFRAKKAERIAVAEAADQEKKRKKREEQQRQLADATKPEEAQAEAAEADTNIENSMQDNYGKFGPYTSPYKDYFRPDKRDKTIAYCICKTGEGQICNATVNPTYGTSVMQQHLMSFHPTELRRAEEKRMASPANSKPRSVQPEDPRAPAVPVQLRGKLHKLHARHGPDVCLVFYQACP